MEEQTSGEKILALLQSFLGNFSGIKNNRVANLLGLLLIIFAVMISFVL